MGQILSKDKQNKGTKMTSKELAYFFSYQKDPDDSIAINVSKLQKISKNLDAWKDFEKSWLQKC